MKAQLALCMKYMPAACMKSLTLTHEGWEFGFAKFQFIEHWVGGKLQGDAFVSIADKIFGTHVAWEKKQELHLHGAWAACRLGAGRTINCLQP